MATKEALQSGMKFLNCFLPVYKPKGFCCNKLMFVVKTDMHFVLNQYEINHGYLEMNYTRALEPFADGLLTFSLGRSCFKKRNFIFADYRYRAKVEFGVEREHSCLDGKVLNRCNTENLSKHLLEEALSNFIGETEQNRGAFIENSYDNKYVDKNMEEIVDIYSKVELPDRKPERVAQKYPLQHSNRDVICYSIKLVEFTRPYATFDIECAGSFSVRLFVEDLAETLNTKASLIELSRLLEGPMNVNDLRVLQLHELHLENYIHRLPALMNAYKNYIDQFDDKFEKTERRPMF